MFNYITNICEYYYYYTIQRAVAQHICIVAINTLKYLNISFKKNKSLNE